MRRHIAVVGSALLVVLLGGCAGAGSGGPQPGGDTTAPSAASTCGTSPLVLNATFETGFDLPFKLSEEFTKQNPNVTWDIKQDQFQNLINATPRLLSGDSPPDLIRLPTMVSLACPGQRRAGRSLVRAPARPGSANGSDEAPGSPRCRAGDPC